MTDCLLLTAPIVARTDVREDVPSSFRVTLSPPLTSSQMHKKNILTILKHIDHPSFVPLNLDFVLDVPEHLNHLNTS